MRICIAILLLVLASPVAAQSLQDCYNGVGVFTTATPHPGDWWWDTCLWEAGELEFFVVLFNPWNENSSTPIDRISGFELHIEWAADWFLTPHLPVGALNAATAPDFACSGADIPVVGGQAVLLRLLGGTFTTDHREMYVRPLDDTDLHSIPGEIAVRDAGDQTMSRATPMYYDYAVPVFGAYHCSPVLGTDPGGTWGECWSVPVKSEERSWGEVKALFR